MLLFFRNEEKNNREEAKGRGQISVRGGWSWERQRLNGGSAHESLVNPLSWMLKAVPWSCVQRLRDGAEQDLGEGREESEDVRGGGEDVEKTQNSSRAEEGEDAFSLIRREHERKLKQHTHTPPLLHTLTPQKKKQQIHHTDFFMVWQSSDKIIR